MRVTMNLSVGMINEMALALQVRVYKLKKELADMSKNDVAREAVQKELENSINCLKEILAARLPSCAGLPPIRRYGLKTATSLIS